MEDHRKYKAGEFAQLLGVTLKTLQKWDKSGILKAYRTPTNRRYYTHSQYLEYMGSKAPAGSQQTESTARNVIYARVSSGNQKDDLKNQTAFLRTFCNAKGIIVDEVIEDIGSGLNYNRKKWNRLLDQVLKGEIGSIYITHKDRFIRFGFDWFERLCRQFGASIVVVNNESLSPAEEMVQDIISILQMFSGRIYGLRKYKKLIREDKEVCNGEEKALNSIQLERRKGKERKITSTIKPDKRKRKVSWNPFVKDKVLVCLWLSKSLLALRLTGKNFGISLR